MDLLAATPWKYVSSGDKSGASFLSMTTGRLVLQNDTNGEYMAIRYRCVGLESANEPPVGAEWSTQTNLGNSFENLGVLPSRMFSSASFPCHGYIIGVAPSPGLIGSIFGMDVSGGRVTAVLFGEVPVFAGIRIRALSNGVLPTSKFTGGLAHYWLESLGATYQGEAT